MGIKLPKTLLFYKKTLQNIRVLGFNNLNITIACQLESGASRVSPMGMGSAR